MSNVLQLYVWHNFGRGGGNRFRVKCGVAMCNSIVTTQILYNQESYIALWDCLATFCGSSWLHPDCHKEVFHLNMNFKNEYRNYITMLIHHLNVLPEILKSSTVCSCLLVWALI